MAEMLLINPRRRRRAAAGKRRATPRRVRRTTARRRRNPLPLMSTISAVRRRRANPVRAKRRASRRRRNPIGMGRMGTNRIFTMLKDAAVGGAGALAVDFAMGQINSYLPLTMRKQPGQVGVYDAVKVGVTVALGHFLSKPTKGLSQKAAMGALTVQAYGLLKNMLPAEISGGLGYYSPVPVARGSGRVGPRGIAAYTRGGTPLLSAYTQGASPLLSGSRSQTLQREGVLYR